MTPALNSTAFQLCEPERHSLAPPETASTLGFSVVVAPHPDDETLGCGGVLALLAAAGKQPRVIVMTDGSRSHPHSRTHPPATLAAVREQETLAALAELGLHARAATFLRFGDCALPGRDTAEFHDAVTRLRALLATLYPDTLFVPWRRDPHCDHQATWHLMRAALDGDRPRPRWLEYPVWAWMQPEGDVAPRTDEGHAWRLDISPVIARKQQALSRHASQLGKIVHDDPTGFTLEPSVLAHFAMPWELFLEPADV